MSILVMLGASFLMANPSANHAGIAEHRARVAAEMARFPYQLDAWHGEDVPIPTAVEDILRPNSLVSRRFRRLGGKETIVVAFIHCSDIRDMLGHHPPHCYPAAGWSPTSIGTTDLAVKLAGETVLMRVYRFRRLDTIGIEQHQTVLSMFLLPDSRRVTEMTDLRGQGSKGRRSSAMGVAQLQLVFSGDPTDDTLEVLASDLLTNVPRSLIDALDAPIATETELLEQQSRGDRRSIR
jgi:hypothetical protein